MTRVLVCILGFLSTATPRYLVAQEPCGLNPEINLNASEDFRKATTHFACSNLNVGAEALVDAGYFHGTVDHSACESDTMNDETARSYIQTEIANKKAAIVATCGYYACKLANAPSSVPNVASLSAVCSQAIEGHTEGANLTLASFKIVPAYMPVVVTGQKQSVKVYVQNTSDGSLTFSHPVNPTGEAVVINPKATFVVPPRSAKWITVQLSKPAKLDAPQMVPLEVGLKNNAGDQRTVNFDVGLSPSDFLPPTGLGCGTFDPHITATAISDRALGEGFDPKVLKLNGPTSVPPGQTNSFKHLEDSYIYNGGGWVTVDVGSDCTQLDATRTHSTVILSFSPATTARSGWCCGGFAPGGIASTDPEWIDDFVLPGTAGRDRWSLTVVTSSKMYGPSPSCLLTRDGVQSAIPSNTQTTNTLMLDPGKHQIRVACQEQPIGSRPGPWLNTLTYNESLNITLDAHLE